MAQSVIEKAIADLGINVPIYKIVADDLSLTFYLYGGRVLTWRPADIEGNLPPAPRAPAALDRDVRDVDGIGQKTADSLNHRGVITIGDLVRAFQDGRLPGLLPKRTLDLAVAWLRHNHYLPREAA
jgi:hypothetical protein